MIEFLLDTNVVIALVNNSASRLGERIRSYPPDVIALPAIVAHELYYGAFISSRRAQNTAEIEMLHFPVLSFDTEDARRAGEVRAPFAPPAHRSVPMMC